MNTMKMRIALGFAMLMGTTLSAQQIYVNEFYRDTDLDTGNEWLEVVLAVDLTAAQLENFHVGDSTSSTAAKFGDYQFTNMASIASTFNAGTIIVIAGDGGPAAETTYNPGGGDWNITLKTTGSNITVNQNNGNFAGTDVVYVDTAGTGDTLSANGFAINWDSTPGVFGANANFTMSNSPDNTTGAFLGSALSGAATDGNWTSDTALGSLTPGQPNGGANTTDINALRALLPVELQFISVE